MHTAFNSVIRRVADERNRQFQKWGVQMHTPFYWIAILVEELGETSEALLKHYEGMDRTSPNLLQSLVNYRREMIEVAAVAVAAIESVDQTIDDLTAATQTTSAPTHHSTLDTASMQQQLPLQSNDRPMCQMNVDETARALAEATKRVQERKDG